MKNNRISWELYALKLASAAAERSEDPYIKVGCCCIRHNNSTASTGYNGGPSGIEINFLDRDLRRKYVIHAEQNALLYCIPGEIKIIATTLLPCNDCLKIIAAYGIKKIVFSDIYEKDDSTLHLAKDFGIELEQIKLT